MDLGRRYFAVTSLLLAPLLGAACSSGISGPRPEPGEAPGEIVPRLVCVADHEREITLRGQGFSPLPTGQLGDDPLLELPAVELQRVFSYDGEPLSDPPIRIADDPADPASSRLRWISLRELRFSLDREVNLAEGLYTVRVTNPAGGRAEWIEGLLVAPPPVLEGIEPTTICAGADSTLAVTGQNIMARTDEFLPRVRVVDQSGLDLLPSSMDRCRGLPGISGFVACERLTVEIPADALAPGRYSVLLKNPDPVDCNAVETLQLDVIEGPQLFFVDPPVIYNGIATRVTLFGSALDQLSTISIRPVGSSDAPTVLEHSFDASVPGRIQALVPEGTAVGDYDVIVEGNEQAPCTTVLGSALKVVDQVGLTIEAIDPPFGHRGEDTAVTILADESAGGGLQTLPRLYLDASDADGPAAPLQSVNLLDAGRVTAVVPAGLEAGVYDLIVVNPDGTVGLLEDAFRVTEQAPPVIDGLSPAAIPNSSGQAVTVSGASFRQPAVTLRCLDSGSGDLLAAQTPTIGATSASEIALTVDASALADGAVCIVRVTNADGSYAEYSALVVSNPAQKLSAFRAGPDLAVARRGLAGAAARATRAARFVYAIGGDGGQLSGVLDTVEVAPVDIFGRPGTFFTQRHRLVSARSLAPAVTVADRCIYLVGGADATGPLTSVERACVLRAEDRPEIADLRLRPVPRGGGLDPGVWTYRLAVLWPADHPENPGGETLPSDPFPLRVPALSGDRQLEVTVVWQAVAGAAGYRLYRSPQAAAAADAVKLLVELDDPATTEAVDDGGTTTDTTPLRPGETGTWHALAATLAEGREAPGAAVGAPAAPGGTVQLYVVGGQGSAGALRSYQRLPITLGADGVQSAGSFSAASDLLGNARSQLAAFSVGPAQASRVPAGQHYIYAGPGVDGQGALVSDVEAFAVQPDGTLGSGSAVDAMSPPRAGYGYAAANNFLFAFGGLQAAPNDKATTAQIDVTPPDLVNWSNAAATMTASRYLMGSAIQSGFIYLLGGTTGTAAATTSTEYVIW